MRPRDCSRVCPFSPSVGGGGGGHREDKLTSSGTPMLLKGASFSRFQVRALNLKAKMLQLTFAKMLYFTFSRQRNDRHSRTMSTFI